ncbi:MAG TPA: Fur family transcriptional regulator [Candidatus Polarisedimenticolia bacterium]|nr:Fur family transcriptional regulator [Candidatus Polarisedimenticolia bacterium]
MPVPRLKDLETALRRRGARPTRQRRVVYAALAERCDHPTAEAIHRAARRRSPGMSLATVYTTLDLLVEAGLAARVAGPDGAARFDARTDRHDHRRCLACGRIEDVERSGEGPRLDPYQRPDFHAVDLRLEIVGYCSGCQDAAGASHGTAIPAGPPSNDHTQGDSR